MYKIMLIEDDPIIATAIEQQLQTWDYQVLYVHDFKDILQQFSDFLPNLVLLDISLPYFNGYHWCDQIRKISQVPIIIISSAADNMNIVMAMNMGADDFIAKPFDIEVLLAKVQAMMRRVYEFEPSNELIGHKGVILNLNDGSLHFQEQAIPLTKNEFKIIKTLLDKRGQVVSREEIMQRLWESDSYVDDNTLSVNITRLRHKLGEHGLTDFILTKKGLGYLVD